VAILANTDAQLLEKLDAFRANQTSTVLAAELPVNA